jgi:hypothetical protein
VRSGEVNLVGAVIELNTGNTVSGTVYIDNGFVKVINTSISNNVSAGLCVRDWLTGPFPRAERLQRRRHLPGGCGPCTDQHSGLELHRQSRQQQRRCTAPARVTE